MPQTLYYYPYATNASTTQVIYTWPQNTTSDYKHYNTQIWQQWCNASTTTMYAPTYANEAWQNWTYVPQYAPQFSYTPEQLRDRAEAEQRRKQTRERRMAARTRARVLLGEFLSDEQNVELERHGRFHVTGSRGRRYCIRAEGQSGNVDLLDPRGHVQATLCCHPHSVPGESYELVPEADAWLMQMIEIRHDEDHFLRTANVHRGRLPAGMR